MKISRGKIEGAQKVTIYGPEGIGKSTFAAQFPNPVFIDTEGSTKHMDVARTPKPSSWAMLFEQVRYFKNNPQECETLVIDTGDWAERLCKEELLGNAQKKSLSSFAHGAGYVMLSEEYGKLLNLLEDLVERGINIVITAHATMRKFEQPDEMGGYDRWEMKLEKKVFPLIKEWSDMVLFANYKTFAVKGDDERKKKAQGGKRVMYTAHHPCWDAKNRHGLKEELPFDFKEIAHCIPVRGETTQTKPPVKYLDLDDQPANTPEAKTVETPKEKPAPGDNVAALDNYLAQEAKGKDQVKQSQEPPKQDLVGVPKPLADLMIANNVTVEEIQQAVSSKGYYPKNTPIENYDPNFTNGVLIGAWVQVFQMIKDFRDDVPF